MVIVNEEQHLELFYGCKKNVVNCDVCSLFTTVTTAQPFLNNFKKKASSAPRPPKEITSLQMQHPNNIFSPLKLYL